MSNPPRRTRPAFTLIELLVVMAIIALLMSILMPSLQRARAQAKSTVCLSNLRQILILTQSYANDHGFLLPPMQYDIADPNGGSQPMARHGWAEVLYVDSGGRYLSYTDNFPVQRNHIGVDQPKRYEVYTCKEGQPLVDSTGHYRVLETSWSRGSLDRVAPELPLICDANPAVTDANDLLRSYIPRDHMAGLYGEAYIDERHYGGANFVYNDGHTERSTNLKEQLARDWDLDPGTPNQ